MKLVSTGSKKKSYKSIKLAAAAAGIDYMVFYMRLRAGKKAVSAMKQPVRKYVKHDGACYHKGNVYA